MNEYTMDEWSAWQDAIREFRRAVGDPDREDGKYKPLFKAIALWGENLVKMRTLQTAEQRQLAFETCRASYEKVKTSD